MKKFIVIFCLVSSLLMILDSVNFGYSLMMFFFVGVIPGTNIQLTPEQMFGLSVIVATLVVAYFKEPKIQNRHISDSK